MMMCQKRKLSVDSDSRSRADDSDVTTKGGFLLRGGYAWGSNLCGYRRWGNFFSSPRGGEMIIIFREGTSLISGSVIGVIHVSKLPNNINTEP